MRLEAICSRLDVVWWCVIVALIPVVALSIFVNVKINSKKLKSKKKGNLHTAIGLESWAFFCDAAAVVVRPFVPPL